jgi:hypothetical protein
MTEELNVGDKVNIVAALGVPGREGVWTIKKVLPQIVEVEDEHGLVLSLHRIRVRKIEGKP